MVLKFTLKTYSNSLKGGAPDDIPFQPQSLAPHYARHLLKLKM